MPTVIDLANLGAGGFVIRGGTAGDDAGFSVATAGDINGDGYDDIVIGVPQDDDGGNNAGTACVVFGKAGGFGTIDLANLGSEGFTIQGDVAANWTGYSVASAGDINGDGFDDLIVGAPFARSSAGSAYVLFGKAGGYGAIDLTSLAPADGFEIRGFLDTGWSVSGAGDVNGDGYDDIIVGLPGGMFDYGTAYVLFGKAGGFDTVDIPPAIVPGDPATDGFFLLAAPGDRQLGYSVSAAGDINGDGYGDLIVGAPQWDVGQTGGKAYVVFGGETFSQGMFMENLTPAQGFVIRAPILYFAGWSVSDAGDVNGDGYDDVLVGAFWADGEAGKAAVIFGKASGFGPIDLATLSATDGFMINGSAGERAGTSVSAAGDVNGDGFADIIIGAPLADGGGTDAGNAYVIFGKASGFGTINLATLAETDGFVIRGGAAGDQAGTSVSAAGDLNGDGFDDLIVGAPLGDAGGASAGQAYVIYGFAPGLVLHGGDGNDALIGGSGNDVLDGGGGADSMAGGRGNDVYYVQDAGDIVTEAAGQGRDRVATSVGYALAAGSEVETIETLTQSDTSALNLSGNEFAQLIVGNNGANLLDGGAGDDVLAGIGGNDALLGGSGNDTMYGGLGNDVYYVQDSGDQVFESGGEGSDRIATSISFALAAGSEVETIETITQSATDALNLYGSEYAQLVVGNNGANLLDGGGGDDVLAGLGGNDALLGGSGNDTMYGGLGNDVYYVQDSGDQVFESGGEGSDRIATSISFALASGSEVETIETITQSDTTALNLYGSEYAQLVVGNNGTNLLDGGGGDDVLVGLGGNDALLGGSGSDIMYGGLGNDTYYVQDVGDQVFESGGEGSDRIAAAVSYTLAAGSEVETIEAVNGGDTAALNFTGNALAQTLIGNAGDNVLDGKGGNDVLVGGAGADSFAFTSALGAGNADLIAGFVSGSDRILLDDAAFAGLGLGALPSGAFAIGTQAQDADDRIIYDAATGALWFDADGNGAGAAVQFATLDGHPPIAASDFAVI
jgi:Ca2+-binding RTX toxin-like protein